VVQRRADQRRPGTCTGSCVFGTTTATATYVQVTQTVVASGPSTTLTFLGRNDPAGIYVDDVSLVDRADHDRMGHDPVRPDPGRFRGPDGDATPDRPRLNRPMI